MSHFILHKTNGKARRATLKTRRGGVETPMFMPVATRAAIKGGVSFQELNAANTQVCLANTYHLHLRPGSELIQEMGGIHKWMKCDRPILTDSGGFQVFSIERKKITDDGVWFNSHIDGQRFYLDAEGSINIQHQIGSDIIMAFDECPPSELKDFQLHEYDLPDPHFGNKGRKKLYYKIKKAVERTTAWAKRSLDKHQVKYPPNLSPTERPQLFGIVQGGAFKELREKSMAEITALPFDGFALGGLAVGEPNEVMYQVLDEVADQLPADKPRYLMGVGTPVDLLQAVKRGIDMFDCVLPMRNARHGIAYTHKGELRVTNEIFKKDDHPLDPNCTCEACGQGISRSYLHHLLKVDEALGKRYMTIHNIHFYLELMQQAREQIENDTFETWVDQKIKKVGGSV